MNETELKWDRIRKWFIWLALPLVVGLIIASGIPRPVIGIIRMNDAIYSQTARDMVTQINYAMDHAEIRAVVLEFDSPGGTVVDTEAAYMELARLRAKKPVVTVVNGMAASGAYYLSVNTDHIYVKPTSLVGNIGVIGYLPPTPIIFEDTISTGPYKLWGAPRDSDMRQIEMIKEEFFQAVMLGRGDKLTVGPEVVLSGKIWAGNEAVRIGIADELGTERDAINKAAEMAHVSNYESADLYDLAGIQSSSAVPFFIQSPQGVTLPYPTKPGMYLLFIPQPPIKQ
ncbi:MAG TPA: S49 family peptidase [Anaerolineales bacterium]|nr:S49 family peptidase [Anaerolineales bacterium]